MDNKKQIDPDILEEMKKIAIARISNASDDFEILVGDQNYSKEEIIESITNGDELGLEMIDAQIEFLRDMASGAFYAEYPD